MNSDEFVGIELLVDVFFYENSVSNYFFVVSSKTLNNLVFLTLYL